MRYKAVILDRDGVINLDSDDYIKSPEEWIPIEGSIEAMASMQQAGIQLAIATNQSGIGRGFYSEDTLNAMHQKLEALLRGQGATLPPIFHCPHLPDDGCHCRKPRPGLLSNALEQLGVNANQCIMVGDSLRDLEAANALNMDSVLVKTGKGKRTLDKQPQLKAQYQVYENLAEFSKNLLENK